MATNIHAPLATKSFHFHEGVVEEKQHELHALSAHEIRVKVTHFGHGRQAIGTVIGLGEKVGRHRLGDTVVVGSVASSCGHCKQCFTNLDHACSAARHNHVHSEIIQLDADWAFPIPASVSVEQALPFIGYGLNAFAALQRHAKKGDRVVVVGFGVHGRLAANISVALGYETSVVADSHYSDAIKLSHATPIAVEEVNKHVREFEIVLVTLGELDSAKFNKLLPLTRRGCRIILLGKTHAPEIKLMFFALVAEELEIIGHGESSKKETIQFLRFAKENRDALIRNVNLRSLTWNAAKETVGKQGHNPQVFDVITL